MNQLESNLLLHRISLYTTFVNIMLTLLYFTY